MDGGKDGEYEGMGGGKDGGNEGMDRLMEEEKMRGGLMKEENMREGLINGRGKEGRMD